MQLNDRGASGRGGLALDKDTQPPTMEDNGNQIFSKYRHKATVQEVPKSQKGRRTRASGYRTWRWAWVPRGDHSAPGRPGKGGPVVSGASVVEGEKGGGKGRGSRGGGLGRQ